MRVVETVSGTQAGSTATTTTTTTSAMASNASPAPVMTPVRTPVITPPRQTTPQSKDITALLLFVLLILECQDSFIQYNCNNCIRVLLIY